MAKSDSVISEFDAVESVFQDLPPGGEALEMEGESLSVGEDGLQFHVLAPDRLVAPGTRAVAAAAGACLNDANIVRETFHAGWRQVGAIV